jgi:hypothetical protein
MFQNNELASSSMVDNEITMLSWNVGNQLPSDETSYPRKTETLSLHLIS